MCREQSIFEELPKLKITMSLPHPPSQDLDLILKNLVESLKYWQLRSIGNDHVNVEMRVKLFIAGEYFLKVRTAC